MDTVVPGVVVPSLPGLVIPFQHQQQLHLAIPIALLCCPWIITSQVLGPHDGGGIEPVDALEELSGCWRTLRCPRCALERTGGAVFVKQDAKWPVVLDTAAED